MNKVKFVFFKEATGIASRKGVNREQMIASDRFDIEIKTNNVLVTKDGFLTIVPMTNVTSIVMMDQSAA